MRSRLASCFVVLSSIGALAPAACSGGKLAGGDAGTGSSSGGGASGGGSGGVSSSGSGGVVSSSGSGGGVVSSSGSSGGSNDTCGTPGVTCTVPPPAPSGPPSTIIASHDYAVRHLYLGDTDRSGNTDPNAWKTFGYDLDGKVTTEASFDVCTQAAG